MTWHYQGTEWQEPEEFNHKDVYGFVYMITNRATGRKYIGKKFFWSQKTLPITKTRKRRKKTLVESDWKNYYGSNTIDCDCSAFLSHKDERGSTFIFLLLLF